MSTRIQFGIGLGEDKHGNPLSDVEARIEKALTYIGLRLGGGFVTRGEGIWHDGTRLVREPDLTITVDTNDWSPAAIPLLSHNLARIFDQAAVHVSYWTVTAADLG